MKFSLWQAQTAQVELASLSAELAMTAPALEAAVHAEREANAAFGSMAAPLLAQSAAAQEACTNALTVLERFPLRRLDFIVHDLKHLAGRVCFRPFSLSRGSYSRNTLVACYVYDALAQ